MGPPYTAQDRIVGSWSQWDFIFFIFICRKLFFVFRGGTKIRTLFIYREICKCWYPPTMESAFYGTPYTAQDRKSSVFICKFSKVWVVLCTFSNTRLVSFVLLNLQDCCKKMLCRSYKRAVAV
jgi:hypothetical protein